MDSQRLLDFKKYSNLTQLAVSNFIFCGKDVLLQRRSSDKIIGAGKLNAVGGRLEPGEDHITAVIRETLEETGYQLTKEQISFAGLINLETFEPDRPNWLITLFRSEVETTQVPNGRNTEDGDLLFLEQKNIKRYRDQLVVDIPYYLSTVADAKNLVFIHKTTNSQGKMDEINVQLLPR